MFKDCQILPMEIPRLGGGGFTFVRKEPKGFTLVEILVAISILAIIGAVSIPNLNGFNESQILQNTTGDLIRVLREAQSSANSHIQCTSTLIAKEWVVDISSGSYNLKVNCYNPTTAATQTDTHYTPTADSINGVSISTRSPSASPCNTVTFSAEYKPYAADRFSNMIFSCNTNLDSKMEIRLSKTGLTTQYICLDKGGGIYASTAACF